MSDQPKIPDRKKSEPGGSKSKIVPDPADDRPQREDEYLSKFLQDPSPEGSKQEGGGNGEEK